MSFGAWLLTAFVVLVAWIAVATALGICVGRVIRRRDRQVPGGGK